MASMASVALSNQTQNILLVFCKIAQVCVQNDPNVVSFVEEESPTAMLMYLFCLREANFHLLLMSGVLRPRIEAFVRLPTEQYR